MTPQKNPIFCGVNLDVVSSWPANCIDSLCTDPPYGLGFMGKEWDTYDKNQFGRKGLEGVNDLKVKKNFNILPRYKADSGFQQWFTGWAQAMLRITKPGGFLLCFGGTRTYHRLACAIEDAGWEIRDCMMWLYGSGFPKSHNISKAIDKAAGAKRKVIGTRPVPGYARSEVEHGKQNRNKLEFEQTSDDAATPLAQLWQGYGTALKPAWEPIIVAMKPLDGTFAHNAEAHQVAGLNIDGGRIGIDSEKDKSQLRTMNRSKKDEENGWGMNQNSADKPQVVQPQGRWPANLILDEESARLLDEQTGTKKSGFMAAGTKRQMSDNPNKNTYGKFNPDTVRNDTYGDSGGASRFFYCAKTSRRERNMGLDDQSGKKVNDGRETPIDNPYQRGETIRKNTHPTVKPLALMKYLCTLLKMPSADQVILDPFLGSGTTGIACKELGINFIGIEKEREYCEIAVKRIAAVQGQEITLETTLPVTKNVETDEQRQKIINAAVVALREKRK